MLKPQYMRQMIAQRRSLRGQLVTIDKVLRDVDLSKPCRCSEYELLPVDDPRKDVQCTVCQVEQELRERP